MSHLTYSERKFIIYRRLLAEGVPGAKAIAEARRLVDAEIAQGSMKAPGRKRLTKPQQRLLDELKRQGEVISFESYPPARALIKAGLALWHKGAHGSGRLSLPRADREFQS